MSSWVIWVWLLKLGGVGSLVPELAYPLLVCTLNVLCLFLCMPSRHLTIIGPTQYIW